MIAICSNPSCGMTFQVSWAVSGRNSTVKMTNVGTSCPRCRSMARFLDGTFRFDNNGVAHLLSGPQFTVQVLRELERIAKIAYQRDYDYEQIKKEAKGNSIIWELLKEHLSLDKRQIRTFLWWLLSVIGTVLVEKAFDNDAKPVVNNYKTEITNIYGDTTKSKPAYSPKQRKPSGKTLRIIKNKK